VFAVTQELFVARRYKGSGVAQVFSRRLISLEPRLHSQAIPCGICGGRSGAGTGIIPSTSFDFPFGIASPVLQFSYLVPLQTTRLSC